MRAGRLKELARWHAGLGPTALGTSVALAESDNGWDVAGRRSTAAGCALKRLLPPAAKPRGTSRRRSPPDPARPRCAPRASRRALLVNEGGGTIHPAPGGLDRFAECLGGRRTGGSFERVDARAEGVEDGLIPEAGLAPLRDPLEGGLADPGGASTSSPSTAMAPRSRPVATSAANVEGFALAKAFAAAPRIPSRTKN